MQKDDSSYNDLIRHFFSMFRRVAVVIVAIVGLTLFACWGMIFVLGQIFTPEKSRVKIPEFQFPLPLPHQSSQFSQLELQLDPILRDDSVVMDSDFYAAVASVNGTLPIADVPSQKAQFRMTPIRLDCYAHASAPIERQLDTKPAAVVVTHEIWPSGGSAVLSRSLDMDNE